MFAGDCDLELRQLLPQDVHGRGQPFRLQAAQEPEREGSLLGVGSPPSGFSGSLDLRQSEPRVIEKHLAGGGQLDAARTAGYQFGADLELQVTYLTAQGWLRRVQPPRGRDGQAACLGHGDEVPEVPQLHRPPHASGV